MIRADARKGDSVGQAMIESLIVVLVVCFVLFSLLQLSHAFASREMMRHAAARTARAKTVGFNAWMCKKVMRVATIPTAGKMLEPSYAAFHDSSLDGVTDKRTGELIDWSLAASPQSERAIFENARIPEYLGSDYEEQAAEILNYERWDEIALHGAGGGVGTELDSDKIEVTVSQNYPLSIMIRSLFDWTHSIWPRDNIALRGSYSIENHASLYIDDKGY